MNPPPRSASFKSTVKCTICFADVESRLMSNHVCKFATGAPFNNIHTPLSAPIAPVAMAPPPSRRPHAPFVPKIDPFAPFPGEVTPASSYGSRAASPASAGSGRASPMRFPTRKVSAPTRRPPSPELLSQDCAFPPFPVSAKPKRKDSTQREGLPSRTQTPDGSASIRSTDSTAKKSASAGLSRQRSRQGTPESRPSTANSSRRPSVNSRRNSREGASNVPPMPPLLPSLSRNNSSSTDNAGISPRPPYQTSSQPSPQPPAMSSAQDVRLMQPTLPVLPDEHASLQPSPVPIQPISDHTFDSILHHPPLTQVPTREPSYKAKRPPPIVSPLPYASDSIIPIQRPKTPPVDPPSSTSGSLSRTLTGLFRKKSTSATSKRNHATKPPATDTLRHKALSPEEEQPFMFDAPPISSEPEVVSPPTRLFSPIEQEEFKAEAPNHDLPSRTFNDTNTTFPAEHDAMNVQNHFEEHVATVPHSNQMPKMENNEEALRRISIDSASSYGSIGFSHSSTSSRTTNPTESLPQDKHGSSEAPSQMPFNFGLPTSKSPAPEMRPDSPTDPTIRANETPTPQSVRSMTEPQAAVEPLVGIAPQPPPEPQIPRAQRPRRPSTPGGTKGTCRGCSQVILGSQKSVSSKDGRLTGRYHKECFACTTCQSAFATADFYVHNDQPYCAHHYHVVNNTLCDSCGKGIEGQYLETSSVAGSGPKKFHPRCLTCSTCKIRLHSDYFEFNGKVYCERDAFRMAGTSKSSMKTMPSRPSPLNREYISSAGPGASGLTAGRFPERRTTKLMMTY